ncbi:MAG: hypothetical protein V7756_12895 [Halopseudomonas sp.]|uniref:hypothetical protein n=1 Tax=Halopseudomonas sp. TaxID=2901191 RepID=UPI003001ADED
MDNPATTSNRMFWRPVKLSREQGFRIIDLRRALLKGADKKQLNGFIVAGREELRQLVDCGAISQCEQDALELEYSRMFSARLLHFLPQRQVVVTPAANEPLLIESAPSPWVTWRALALVAASATLGLVAGIYINELLGGLLAVSSLVLGGDK